MTLAQLEDLLQAPEGEQLEFKEAKKQYDSRKLRKYLAALANEGGGHLILGVSDERPPRVVGTEAFSNIQRDLVNIRQYLRPAPTLTASEIAHPDGRILVLTVGSRPRGQVVRCDRIAWARIGEALAQMPDDDLRAVLLEDTDVSAELCEGLGLNDLDPSAVEAFQQGIIAKTLGETSKARYAAMSRGQLLNATGLVVEGQLTLAAVLLLGNEEALVKHARNAEIVFEYRRVPTAIRYDRRFTLRRAILLAVDDLWEAVQPYAFENPIEVTDGTRVTQRPRFPERSVREALLNAITHRDYHDDESVFIRMSPDTFEITSPGPFPATITPENIAEKQYRRNRVLAEGLERCGQIERSGQGVDLMIQAAVQQAQPLPTFEEPEGATVRVTLYGRYDADGLRIMQRIPEEIWNQLDVGDLRALNAVRRGLSRREIPADAARHLIELGLIQTSGRGDSPLVFSDSFDRPLESLTVRLLDVLTQHPDGITLGEITAELAEVDTGDVKRELQWLRRQGMAYTVGRTRGARWVLEQPDVSN